MQLVSVCVSQESVYCHIKESFHLLRAAGHDIEVQCCIPLQYLFLTDPWRRLKSWVIFSALKETIVKPFMCFTMITKTIFYIFFFKLPRNQCKP